MGFMSIRWKECEVVDRVMGQAGRDQETLADALQLAPVLRRFTKNEMKLFIAWFFCGGEPPDKLITKAVKILDAYEATSGQAAGGSRGG